MYLVIDNNKHQLSNQEEEVDRFMIRMDDQTCVMLGAWFFFQFLDIAKLASIYRQI
jgi:hypothetical protein